MSATGKRDLIFSYDVGHSSIGWNVLKETASGLEEVALGTVIFEADGCLASKRRTYRRMRRTIRSRRQRIEVIEQLFIHQGILSEAQIKTKHSAGGGNSAPWLLAAAVLAGKGFALNAGELFDVLRWYAHNRGYDGNRRWATNAGDEDSESKREEAARALMNKHGTSTMAETICAQLGLEPGGHKKAATAGYKDKEIGAAFPRKTVVEEVERILQVHIGKVKGCTPEFITSLCGDSKEAWSAVSISGIKKQKNYEGGLLFGQKVPRFDNRILSFCPVTNTPTPLKSAKEFLEFRCAMFLSNVRACATGESAMRPLSKDELTVLWKKVHATGYLTTGEFQKTVRKFDGVHQDNLEALMTIEDMEKNLVVDPPLKLLSGSIVLKNIIPLIPKETAETLLSNLWKKQSFTLAEILAAVPDGAELADAVDAAFKKDKGGQKKYGTKERWLEGKVYHPEFDSGRAPYARAAMRQTVEEILGGRDPRAKGGCLYITEEMQKRQEDRSLDELTNNHLVRHRLLILQRLFRDMMDEFCEGDKGRIQTVVVEMNREVSQMSGKTNKQIAQEEGIKRADHKKARQKLEEAAQESGENVNITAGLIRKARIAQDLGWTCPYTGEKFGPMELIYGQVDLDHIIPRSERLSDSMAGLVVTFSEVNRWKGARSAFQFVTDEQGKPVQGRPNLSIQPFPAYKDFVAGLRKTGGHASDEARRAARKGYLMLPSYQDKEFTPRDLTISSYVAKLAVQQVKKEFSGMSRPPQVVSLPGRLTGEARKAWKLTGLLHAVNETITGDTPKDDIRGLTHLHHALDAAVMGLMAHCTGNLSDGTTWQLLLKRSLMPHEKSMLAANMRNIGFDGSRAHLMDVPDDIKEQLRKRLLERRVVQHVPASMEGMRVDENTSGVIDFDEKTGKVKLHQFGKPTESRVPGKLLGYEQSGSKLWKHRGVRIITENFGVALASEPEVIRWHKVYPHLSAIETKDGKWPVVWRRGQIIIVPEGRQKGVWRISGIDENMRDGIIIKICSLDGLERAREAGIKSLLRSNAHLVKTRLTGDEICRITSSILGAQPSA